MCAFGMTGEERVYVHYGLVQTNLSPVSNLTHSKIAVSNTKGRYSPTHVTSQVTPMVCRSILPNRWKVKEMKSVTKRHRGILYCTGHCSFSWALLRKLGLFLFCDLEASQETDWECRLFVYVHILLNMRPSISLNTKKVF